MKKQYEAPAIYFDDFSLSTSIAGDCDTIIKNLSKDSCAYMTRTGLAVFTSSLVDVCTTHEDDGEYNGFCYHVPTSYTNLFNS